ncbi:hypothetical protein [Hamadaea tsunoensis]|uniref:hypothetical protein n=1 Tax=Hamadaea tsunoensis TaxID=53368 RepID=UPI0012FC4E6E|nr:hypothetical protein [Hamadaea tsunoensis]
MRPTRVLLAALLAVALSGAGAALSGAVPGAGRAGAGTGSATADVVARADGVWCCWPPK